MEPYRVRSFQHSETPRAKHSNKPQLEKRTERAHSATWWQEETKDVPRTLESGRILKDALRDPKCDPVKSSRTWENCKDTGRAETIWDQLRKGRLYECLGHDSLIPLHHDFDSRGSDGHRNF